MTQAVALRRQSIRVALAATLVVGVLYALIAGAVITFATVDLTSQVDQRLVGSFGRLPPGQSHLPISGFNPGGDPGRPFGPPVLAWTINPDGSVAKASNAPDLPAGLEAVTGPVTATIDGEQVRVAGSEVAGVRVIVAQSLDSVADTQRTILLGTLIIAPFLLLLVFGGSVIVGRRVAAPVEEARQRQLDFTADASHELRTPLSVIEANTSLALARERDGEWYRTTFAKVDRESKRMRQLLEDMLWLARFDAAGTAAKPEPIDMATIARQSVDRFAPIAETRSLTLTLDAPDEPVIVNGQAEMLDRLVAVLVDNACKYAPQGGRVAVHVATEGGRALLAVDDSGPGISDEERERVFDRFHRSVATAGEADGAGLGLAIADAVVKQTRGRWAVTSSPLGGARFSVRWPA
ncbi:MAG TPA: HAMP domain-containing sensor histidine kinase [Candidatus Limnocylindrales bacterium]